MHKVFFLIYGLNSGGIERVAVNAYKYIDKSKYDLHLVTKYDKRQFFDDELESYGGKREPVLKNCNKTGIKKKIAYARSLSKLIKDGYDIGYFNLNAPKDAFKYPLLCRLKGIKHIVIHSHNSSEDAGSLINRMMNALGRRLIKRIADKKLTCSELAAKWMFDKKTVAAKDYIQINNGVDLPLFAYNKEVADRIRGELGIDDSTFVVGHIGRFSPQKNHTYIIDIFEKIHEKNNDSVLLLLGDGKRTEEIKSYAEAKELTEAVKFMGAKSNANEYLQAFDIFLMPSLYEGLPVVGIEAQAAGLKCFMSDVITRKVDITGNVDFISLDKSPEEWAGRIIDEYKSFVRKDVSDIIKKKHFDVQGSIGLIEKTLDDIFVSGKK